MDNPVDPPPPYDATGGEFIEGPGSAKGTGKGLLVGVGVAAFVLLAAGAGMYFTVREPDDPQGVLEEYIKALDNGQCEKAISHVDLGGMSREEFISTCEQLDVEVESVDVTDVSPDGEIVWVTVKVNMTSDEGLWSTNEPTRVPVHRVDGEWKVLATWQTANAG